MFQLLRNTAILLPVDGLPVQAPPGLDTARQTFIFEKIREFCNEEATDITCPAPKSRAGQKHVPSFVAATIFFYPAAQPLYS
jgi:hypothetical protein